MKDGKKIILTYGTYDLFHIGHVNLLRRAKALGDYLIVGISTDEFNSIKGKKSIYPYEDRKQIVESIKWVDETFPENTWEQKLNDIEKYRCDVFVMGDDWKGKFDFLQDKGIEVVYLPRTEGISTTETKEKINSSRR